MSISIASENAYRTNMTPDLDSLCNLAVAAWVKTFPIEENLIRFLDTVDDAMRIVVESQSRHFIGTAEKFLWDWQEPIGETGHAKFSSALETYLKSGFPWAEDQALRSARSFTRYCAWREGL